MSSTAKTIILKTFDGETFEVEETVAQLSLLLKNMIEDDCANTSIPIPNVTGKILSKVIDYCRKHVTDKDDLRSFDSEFIGVDDETLLLLANAAQFLDINCLLNLCSETLFDRLKEKDGQEIRQMFNIENLPPQEEADMRKVIPWAFE